MKYCTKGGKCCLTDKTLSSGEKYCGISWILEIYRMADGAIQTHNYQGPEFFCFVLFFLLFFLEWGDFSRVWWVGGRET